MLKTGKVVKLMYKKKIMLSEIFYEIYFAHLILK